LSSKRTTILTRGIVEVFQGIKTECNTEIEPKDSFLRCPRDVLLTILRARFLWDRYEPAELRLKPLPSAYPHLPEDNFLPEMIDRLYAVSKDITHAKNSCAFSPLLVFALPQVKMFFTRHTPLWHAFR
jgi:hypothetical protein